MGFLWTTIHVSDMESSLAFYRDIVGLSLNRRMNAGHGTEIAFLGDDATKVELLCAPGQGGEGFGKGISLGFQVKSVDEKLAFLAEKGIPIHHAPVQPNPHIRFFHVLDPDGLEIQFVEQM
jgi:lactoylglutathione lyase